MSSHFKEELGRQAPDLREFVKARGALEVKGKGQMSTFWLDIPTSVDVDRLGLGSVPEEQERPTLQQVLSGKDRGKVARGITLRRIFGLGISPEAPGDHVAINIASPSNQFRSGSLLPFKSKSNKSLKSLVASADLSPVEIPLPPPPLPLPVRREQRFGDGLLCPMPPVLSCRSWI